MDFSGHSTVKNIAKKVMAQKRNWQLAKAVI
jgi:hypothetical protein